MIVIRISEVMMQKTGTNQKATTNHRQVQASTTLSRKYLKRPTKQTTDSPVVGTDIKVSVKKTPKLTHFYSSEMQNQQMDMKMAESVEPHPIQNSANMKLRQRKVAVKESEVKKISARELKDQAIQKALASATIQSSDDNKKAKKTTHIHFGVGRVLLALGCAAAAVFAVVYFVNLNMPDISLRVAAMQTGIDPSYPKYVPRDYSVSSITSEAEKITLEFKNSDTNQSFSLIEEKSAWDTNALLSNYVKEEYGEKYSMVREQGLTIYVSGSDAAWVNGGIVYKIKANDGVLTNKQIRSIAISL